MTLKLSQICIYPIKSCGGISLPSALAEPRGLQYDRRWMLVDDQGRFISQRECSNLALIRMVMHDDTMVVYHVLDQSDQILVPFFNIEELSDNQRIKVQVWDDICDAIIYPDFINRWFSEKLGISCRLVYMPDDSIRKVDPGYANEGEITSFSDGYPVLLISEASLTDLNQKLNRPIPINRFRPNLMISGAYPFQEDEFKYFKIHQVLLQGVKLCARCNIPTIDQETGIASQEPTATLATYRLFEKKILFGQNVLIKNPGTIRVGDELILI